MLQLTAGAVPSAMAYPSKRRGRTLDRAWPDINRIELPARREELFRHCSEDCAMSCVPRKKRVNDSHLTTEAKNELTGEAAVHCAATGPAQYVRV